MTAILIALAGCALIVAGAFLWSMPAGLVVLGVMLTVVGLLFDFEE